MLAPHIVRPSAFIDSILSMTAESRARLTKNA
jgi:hypothetical protein